MKLQNILVWQTIVEYPKESIILEKIMKEKQA